MSEHKIRINWQKGTEEFTYETYDRTHEISFEGGRKILASATSTYFGKAEYANPEELITAALCSCHLLTFLAVAARKKFTILQYSDAAVATLEKNPEGKLSIVKIDLYPRTKFSSDKVPDMEELRSLHELSHKNCFIGNSIKSQVVIHPEIAN
ncbi:osmotically inducible protein OsmC [Leptospira perolatii]|uniref:Osmotically inducible protein OsmC n=1 Tax=Leptospira perolatii TaxID=2023191 RepID=A0A2M9ZRG1_9LEPT|nr:OsmC family protein [Leptospira perolatii]PJZ71145.1 osmotically inducible protein OsmC [Leptospira perolatii]PJZ74678.1 osmotically inducible protein OsmC [Leptospira perolatii]